MSLDEAKNVNFLVANFLLRLVGTKFYVVMNSFFMCRIFQKALSLQGQAFQRLACWVLQHNPWPEVPFQVDNDSRNKKFGTRTSL